ncbi:type II toxin-antitoxin system CcdA family antitoxin [Pseudidiomarina homiensis]|uniref:Acetoacetyl-CoA synthase n=1 Tax=Pseudidiomarina homiensis TaxID=364198 RepID=A0A432Y5P9_9GAMM|nr:type II toxin-antitoxin system CcdA family antitoxin [Pseudidiomarina homiensis]RUO56325.1 acetoacetyl-CoA synthase [Pseudidiomarina homiensis]
MNYSPPKKPTNLSVSEPLLSEAKALKINLSATFERALTEEVRKQKRLRWRQENKEAVQEANDFAKRNGLFAAKHRVF